MAVAAHGHLVSPAIHASQLNRAGERVRGAMLWLLGFSACRAEERPPDGSGTPGT